MIGKTNAGEIADKLQPKIAKATELKALFLKHGRDCQDAQDSEHGIPVAEVEQHNE